MSRALLDEEEKSWSRLESEMKGLTPDFNKMKDESYDCAGWGDEDEDGLIIGDDGGFGYDTHWKVSTVRMVLEDNLDYGIYNETDEREDDESPKYDSKYHCRMCDIRDNLVEQVAWGWVFIKFWDKDLNDFVERNINSLESAQAYCNELIKQLAKD